MEEEKDVILAALVEDVVAVAVLGPPADHTQHLVSTPKPNQKRQSYGRS